MDDRIRRDLSKALRKVDQHLAHIVSNPDSELHRYAESLFQDHQIYQVVHAGRSRPISFYAGYAPGSRAWILTGSPDSFVRLARADGIAIDSSEKAEQYAICFFESTRSMSDRIYLVRSADDVEFLTDVEEDVEAAASLRERLRSVIVPHQVESAEDGYQVVLYAVHDQSLERHTLRIASDGGVARAVEMLDEDLPLVYGI